MAFLCWKMSFSKFESGAFVCFREAKMRTPISWSWLLNVLIRLMLTWFWAGNFSPQKWWMISSDLYNRFFYCQSIISLWNLFQCNSILCPFFIRLRCSVEFCLKHCVFYRLFQRRLSIVHNNKLNLSMTWLGTTHTGLISLFQTFSI